MIFNISSINQLSEYTRSEIYDHIDVHTIHLFGDKNVETNLNEVIVLCLMQNGSFYLNEFINYYLYKLKVKHIFFLDNGSTDNSLTIIKKYSNVTVVQSLLPFKIFRKVFRDYLLEKFGKNKWCLLIDIDEFFDYPFSNIVPLNKMVQYLNINKYTTIVTQMLDMFPAGDVLQENHFDNFRKSHCYYDISSIVKKRYWDKRLNNSFVNRAIRLHFGGIRKKEFDLESVLLSKHSLILNKGEIYLDHIHWVKNASVSDFSAVIYHYKFHAKFLQHVKSAIKKENYHDGSKEYKSYLKKVNATNALILSSNKSKKIKNVNELLFNYFLFVSIKFFNHCYKDAHDTKDLLKVSTFLLETLKNEVETLKSKRVK